MKIKKEDFIKMLENIPYEYVNFARICFQNAEIKETDDEFNLNIE